MTRFEVVKRSDHKWWVWDHKKQQWIGPYATEEKAWFTVIK
jgi:hypothetical protein